MSHQKLNEGHLGVGVIRLYGITQDLEKKNYMMVLDYAINGSLRNYLDTSYNKLSWFDKINDLSGIAFGLKHIHNNKIIHQDLHVGNILHMNRYSVFITDMGLC